MQVELPKLVLVPIGEEVLLENWDEKFARLTTSGRDFEKMCYDLMKLDLVNFQMKAIVKNLAIKTKLDGVLQTIANKAQGLQSASSSSTSASSSSGGKRGLKRNLSEISVPEELKAPSAKAKPKAKSSA